MVTDQSKLRQRYIYTARWAEALIIQTIWGLLNPDLRTPGNCRFGKQTYCSVGSVRKSTKPTPNPQAHAYQMWKGYGRAHFD